MSQLGQFEDMLTGNILDRFRDALQNLVVELKSRHDLVEDALDVLGVFLWFLGRDRVYLSGTCVLLDVLHLLLLVIAAKDTIRDLVQEILEEAGVAGLALLESALELFDFVLSQLVRDLTSDRVQEVNASECSYEVKVSTTSSRLRSEMAGVLKTPDICRQSYFMAWVDLPVTRG